MQRCNCCNGAGEGICEGIKGSTGDWHGKFSWFGVDSSGSTGVHVSNSPSGLGSNNSLVLRRSRQLRLRIIACSVSTL